MNVTKFTTVNCRYTFEQIKPEIFSVLPFVASKNVQTGQQFKKKFLYNKTSRNVT